MAQLAIKGHHTRGKEVIEILEMLGGKNVTNLDGSYTKSYYFVDNNLVCSIYGRPNSQCYTLEEFEDKFPYKIGDEVKTIYDEISIVKQLVWSNKDNDVKYELEVDEGIFYFANELQPYKEETITIDDFKANTKEWLIDKLESMSKDNALQSICNIYDELHKPKYPKTYEECCEMLNTYHNRSSVCYLPHKTSNYDLKLFSLLETFRQLIVCRDAYWKIVGEQMGLGKPWEPDWSSCEDKLCITIFKNKQTFDDSQYISRILTFPTEEIRDAFYKNFKDLIEKCKELL